MYSLRGASVIVVRRVERGSTTLDVKLGRDDRRSEVWDAVSVSKLPTREDVEVRWVSMEL